MSSPPVVLIGPMGAGKTRVGKRVARLLGAEFTDTDKVIVAEHGPIADLFAQHGEAYFRGLERDAVSAALATDDVVSLGGGAVLDPATQADLHTQRVVFLTVTARAVEGRLGEGKRPLLRNGLSDWQRIFDERRDIYEGLSDLTIDTSHRPYDAIAQEVAAWARDAGVTPTTEIPVAGNPGYSVFVGRGLLADVGEHLGAKVKKVLIVHAPTLGARAETLRAQLADRYQVFLAEIPDAEGAKRVEVAAFCWQILGQTDFTRSDAVIGLGGGATTDLAGFVAATWLRGIDVVQIPTTVLGMVDAAVGGKTGINTAEGKNLVGAFHMPRAVLCDLDTLDGLPKNEILAGYAEIAKAGFIAEPEILDIIEADVDAATDPATPQFRRAIELAIAMKARIVGEDFTEQGLREILNYGHTLGHAIEHAERYQWRHGAAISIGMVFAAELSRLTRSLSDAAVDRHRSILESLSLPTTYPIGRWKTLLATMKRDKKARGDLLRFIVLDDIGRPTTLTGPEEQLLFAAYQEISE